MSELPRIEVEVTFIPAAEGGRAEPPLLVTPDGSYRPHLVVGDPRQRRAVLAGHFIDETYLGVAFVSGPERVEFDRAFTAELALIFDPHPAYDALVPGATFTIREGARVVGFGEVKRVLPPGRV